MFDSKKINLVSYLYLYLCSSIFQNSRSFSCIPYSYASTLISTTTLKCSLKTQTSTFQLLSLQKLSFLSDIFVIIFIFGGWPSATSASILMAPCLSHIFHLCWWPLIINNLPIWAVNKREELIDNKIHGPGQHGFIYEHICSLLIDASSTSGT